MCIGCAGLSLGHDNALSLPKEGLPPLLSLQSRHHFPREFGIVSRAWGKSAVCFWLTAQENLYIPAFGQGNSLVQSEQQTVAEHKDTLKYLRVKCSYRLIQKRRFSL